MFWPTVSNSLNKTENNNYKSPCELYFQDQKIFCLKTVKTSLNFIQMIQDHLSLISLLYRTDYSSYPKTRSLVNGN